MSRFLKSYFERHSLRRSDAYAADESNVRLRRVLVRHAAGRTDALQYDEDGDVNRVRERQGLMDDWDEHAREGSTYETEKLPEVGFEHALRAQDQRPPRRRLTKKRREPKPA